MAMIALDFDETYTAMPEVWDNFIDTVKATGHSIVVVTARHDRQDCLGSDDNSDITDLCNRKNISVIYCGQKPKRAFCESLDYFFNIWIDDSPQSII